MKGWKSILTFGLVFALLVTFSGCGKREETGTKPRNLSNQAEARLRELAKRADTLTAKTSPRTEKPLSKMLQDRIGKDGKSYRAGFLLAHAHLLEGDYTKGIGAMQSLLGRRPNSAEIHEALANAYYELAILDIVSRKLYQQNSIGFFLFEPDDQSRLILAAAQAEFDAAGEGGTLSSDRARLRNLKSYLAAQATDVAVTIDQTRACMWMLALSDEDPSLTELVKHNLDAYRWMLTLQNPPPLPDPIVDSLRRRHHEALNNLKSEQHIIPLKGVYDLGCAISAWRQMWTTYQIIAQSGRSSPAESQAVLSLGKQIHEYADLLSLDLTDKEKKYLKLQYHEIDAFQRLSPNIERQLESRHGRTYRQVYALAYSQSGAITILRNRVFAEPMWQRLAMLDVATLATLADAVNAESKLREGATQLKKRNPSPDLAIDVKEVADKLFMTIIAHVEVQK